MWGSSTIERVANLANGAGLRRGTGEVRAGRQAGIELGGHRFELPALYHRVECFRSVHLASYDAVRALLPSDEIRPVRWFDGRAAIQVAAMRYRDISGVVDGQPGLLAPYGEVGISAIVTRRPAPRGVALLAADRLGVGGFVVHLPVTTLEARDLGRVAYGLPKFVADMEFLESPSERRLTLAEGGEEILTLSVRPGGRVVTDRGPLVMYSSLGGQLLEVTMPVSGHRQSRLGRRGGRLRLGSHLLGRQLGELSIDLVPLATDSFLDLRWMLPPGVPVGAARGHAGYAGSERERGRFTVAYPGTGPIDQYAQREGVLHGGGAAEGARTHRGPRPDPPG